MAEPTNRTFICGVLYLDIVEFSLRPVVEQIRLKERFNAALTEAIAGVGADDRIILDTGGGAALTFLGDPEDALFSGLSVRGTFARHVTAAGTRAQIRIGINVGPVRLIKDVNGWPSVIGDGVDRAQSIMKFAEPGQILVSRSYYHVMTRLSESYAALFHYEGAKTDKDRGDYEVYAVSAAASSVLRGQRAKTNDARKSPGWAQANATMSPTGQRPELGWTAAIVAWMRNLFR